jgi:adenylate cyclase class 2
LAIEVEVKLECDVEELRDAHPELVWREVEPRHFEENIIYDTAERALRRRESILRVRKVDGRARVAYKGLVPESADARLKVREEVETGVDDPHALAVILSRLGYERVFRYQKYRTTYELTYGAATVLAMHDETPLGGFLELEGESAAVEAVAAALGYSAKEFVTESYIGMQARRCRERGTALEDLVF